MGNNAMCKDIVLVNQNDDSQTLSLKKNYRVKTNTLKFGVNYEYTTLNSSYGNINVKGTNFTPQKLEFETVTVFDDMKTDEWIDFLTQEHAQFRIDFIFEEANDNQSVFVDIVSLEYYFKDHSKLKEFDITFETKTPFFVIEEFKTITINNDGLDFGSKHPLKEKVNAVHGSSASNTLLENKLNFEVRGNIGAFLEIQMVGPSTNPAFGFDKNIKNTDFGYQSVDTVLKENEVLDIINYVPLKKITKGTVNIEQDRDFSKELFELVPSKPKAHTIVFTNVPQATLKVYSLTPGLVVT